MGDNYFEKLLLKINSADPERNAIALCNQNEIIECVTYRDLSTMCDRFEECFSKKFSNVCCGLFMKQNIYLPSVILSLQKINCPFIFLQKICKEESNNVAWILSFENLEKHTHLSLEDTININNETKIYIFKSKNEDATKITNCENILCIVKSSGSTGEPKTIQVPVECIGENVEDLMQKFQISSNDKILWATPLSFDPSLIELLLTLFSGASLIIVPYNTYLNQNNLFEVLKKHGVTFFQVVPSILLRWNVSQIEYILNCSSLRILAIGGEEFPKKILNIPRKSDLRIFNLYGVTELSCWATIHEITNEKINSDVPLGEELSKTKLIIGADSELFLKSSFRFCIVNGISNKNQFIPTGDLVRKSNNEIYYVGRKNKIIKRFGNKVNLASIEETIFKESGFQNKCIWSKKLNKILTFILLQNFDFKTRQKIVDKIRVKLIHLIPESSFPDYFEGILKYPLSCHGKINETALEQFYINNLKRKSDEDCIEIFSRLWFEQLGISSENFQDNKISFFEMGGNSILAMQVLSEFKGITKVEIPEGLTQCLFEYTLEDCINCLEKQNIKTKRKLDADCDENSKKLMKTLKELKIKWKYDLKACVDCTPLIFEKGENTYVAAGSYSHIFVVIDKNGREITKIVLPNIIESTPCHSDCSNFLYVGCFDGNLYCIDYMENIIVWKYFTGDRIRSAPLVCKNKNSSAVVFGSYDQFVHCIKCEDGHLIWKTLLQGNIVANIIKNDTFLYAATTKGYCYCMSKDIGDILWSSNVGCPMFGSPCIFSIEGQILWPGVEGNICLCSEDGKMKLKFKADGLIFSSLVSYNKHIYFGCLDGNLYKVELDENSGEVVSKIPLDSAISTSPFIDEKNGHILVACNSGCVYLISLNSFAVLYSCKLSGEIFSSPVSHEDGIYVGCRDNFLYCLTK